MQVRVNDLPVGGRDFVFEIDITSLNNRLSANRDDSLSLPETGPICTFQKNCRVSVHVELEGITVFIKGEVLGDYKTQCSRCGENILKTLKADINMVLKPVADERKSEQVEDINFGYYDGSVVDCGDIAEEFLVLSLPFVELCKRDCRGLCPDCGTNLNNSTCDCANKPNPHSPFAALSKLKLQ